MENITNYFLSKQFYLFHDYDYSLLSQSGGRNNKKRWDKLYHNGPMFPDDYVPHKIPILFKNESIVLSSEAEEYGTIYAKYIGSEYIKNKKFNKNFWNDWKHMVKNTKITSLDDCDFSLIQKHILKEKEKKMNISKEERTKLIEGRKIQEQPFLFATVDGKKEKIGNYKIEPPGIFIGRGCHPLLGSIKPRILPQDITLNLSKDAPIPNSVYGNKWGEIIHDPYVDWLASYLDIISGKTKYIWLSASSSWKMENDQEKFDLSRKLKRKIKSIRDDYSKLLKDTLKNKQIATCIYFIDYLALRVGNEKGAEESDTVGITSLRVEHLQLMDDLNIKLDFLGKDSVRYVKVIRVDEQVYNNLITFVKHKNKDDNIFDLISTTDLNKYLQSLMDGLTAKVFRTYNASTLFYDELFSIQVKQTMDENEKMEFLLDKFNQANIKVASLCNHQKNVQKNFKEQINKLDEDIHELKNKKKQEKNKTKLSKLNTKIKKLKSKKELKLELKNISLGTSKINYIDPRITVAWIKKYNFPVEKIFSETLREKFAWAFNADETFVY
jgi:DNA topoisomerase-1